MARPKKAEKKDPTPEAKSESIPDDDLQAAVNQGEDEESPKKVDNKAEDKAEPKAEEPTTQAEEEEEDLGIDDEPAADEATNE